MSGIEITGSPNSWVNGKLGKAAHFEGNTANVIYNNTTEFNYTDNFSVALWVKPNYTGTTSQYLFTVGRADAGGYGYGLQVADATKLTFRFGNTYKQVACNTGEWHHFVMYVTDSKLYVYKDGELQNGHGTATTLPTYSDGNGLGIGCFHYSGNIYPGYGDICDFRIYDHALSPREVKEISKGLVCHYTLSGIGGDNLLRNTNTGATYWYWSGNGGTRTATATEDGGVKLTAVAAANSGSWSVIEYDDRDFKTILKPSTTYTASLDIYPPYSTSTFRFSIRNGNATDVLVSADVDCVIQKDKWNHCEWTFTTKDTLTISNQIVYMTGIPSTIQGYEIYLKNIKVEEGSRATPWTPNPADDLYTAMGLDDGIEYDVSGYGHNGTKNNTSLIGIDLNTPRYNTSTVFKRTNSANSIANIGYIKTENFYMPDEFTVSFWWYYDSQYHPNGNPPSTFAYGSYTGYSSNGIHNYDNKYIINLATGDSDTKSTNGSVNNFYAQDKVWVFVSIVFNGYEMVIYKNGVLFGKYTASTSTKYHIVRDNQELYVGCDGAGSVTRGVSGNMSDFRIYATALSAEDILALYNNPVSLSSNGALLTQGEVTEV